MRSLPWSWIVCAALGVAGCASAPPTLVALPAPAAAAAAVAPSDAPTSIRLRRVHLPEYLDGFPVLVAHDDQVLIVAERTEWAERPSEGVKRVLRDALAQRLGSSRVLIAGDGRRADADLTVEVMALDPERGALHLDARWSLGCRSTGANHAGRTALRVEMVASTAQGVAQATSEAISRLADALTPELRCEGRDGGNGSG